MTMTVEENTRPRFDTELASIADYVLRNDIKSELALSTARYCLLDSFACAFLALQYPACTSLLGPIIAGTTLPIGARVPGTNYFLDPILAAFNIGTLVRWLDFNDTWLAAEWGHPSDNLGAILAVSDYMSRKHITEKKPPLLVKDILFAMIKAHEIQGILALENSFNRLGFDHVILVKIASTAIASFLLGGDQSQILDALSQVYLDGACLRTYRHAPNTGSRKSWAAGDATSRAVRLAWMTMQGEMGYPSALSAKKWGFNEVILRGNTLRLGREFDTYVMENVLFKIAFPAEFHAQTAVEAAIQLHPQIIQHLHNIQKIVITTQEPAIRIISKAGTLHNPADRDHCLQYMVAVTLLHGKLRAEFYENDFAKDARIDALRNVMQVVEDQQFTRDYYDQNKRSIANAVQIFFKDGSETNKITVEYPLGHRKRREEGIPLLMKKVKESVTQHYAAPQADIIMALFEDADKLMSTPVNELMDLLVKEC